ncbi:LysR substrate-binding domain-containing protein [Rhizobium wenxiniae]|uniref:LysR substrate-binding domain-containing protein n=1 Tax=Rhizobium wenxiniae TaxID=1737357 RepID=UPI003C2B2012
MRDDRWSGVDAFVAVQEGGSFAAAAARLKLSTSQVSRDIADLERRLHARLFIRTTRRLKLTAVGEQVLERFKRLVADREDVFDLVSADDGQPAGLIRLTCSVSYGERFIAPLISEFIGLHPNVDIEIDLDNAVVDLVEGKYDLAIRSGELPDSGLTATRLSSRILHLCATPGYLAAHGTPETLGDLASHSCLIGTAKRWHFTTEQRPHIFRPKGRWQCNSGAAVVDAALRGLGICQLPDFYVRDHVASGALVSLFPEVRPAPEGIWIVYPDRAYLPSRIKALIKFLKSRA